MDAAKLTAAAAVVWIHVVNCEASHRYLVLAGFAVPFFTCAAVYFVLEKAFRDEQVTVAQYCVRRARQLYLPFLAWALVYLLVRIVKHRFFPGGSPIVMSPAVLLNGTAHHLWFLPFICIASAIAYAAGRLLRNVQERHWKWLALGSMAAGLLLTVFVVAPQAQVTEVPISYFLHQSTDTIPAIFFGGAVFFFSRVVQPSAWLRVLAIALPIVCVGWEFWNGGNNTAVHIAGAGLLLFTLLQPEYRWTAALAPWADLAFVIYLVHVLFVETFVAFEVRYRADSLALDLGIWAAACIGSAMLARLIVKWRPLRAVLA